MSNWLTPENNIGETSTCRPFLTHWCMGAGIDIGFGGAAPIKWNSICVDKILLGPHGSQWPPHLILDAFRDLPFKGGVLDYVYSSHCLEDAVDTVGVLAEWCRVLKPGGYLVLFLPDQVAYIAYCREHHTLPNQDHKYAGFSMSYVISCLPEYMSVVHQRFPLTYNHYSFELVAAKAGVSEL